MPMSPTEPLFEEGDGPCLMSRLPDLGRHSSRFIPALLKDRMSENYLIKKDTERYRLMSKKSYSIGPMVKDLEI